jgi:2-keto-4-pentenoate hydratase
VRGHLLADSVSDAATPAGFGQLVAPRVEIEIAFVLAAALTGHGLTVDDVLAATGALHLALEIVDSRWAGGAPSLGLLVADNVSNAGAVLGAEVDLDADLGTLQASLTIAGQHSHPSEALGHPAAAVAWLAESLAGDGAQLNAGDVVLSGTLCPPLPVGDGAEIVAGFSPLGELRTTVRWADTARRNPPAAQAGKLRTGRS